jgi:hypothetical protein
MLHRISSDSALSTSGIGADTAATFGMAALLRNQNRKTTARPFRIRMVRLLQVCRPADQGTEATSAAFAHALQPTANGHRTAAPEIRTGPGRTGFDSTVDGNRPRHPGR